MSTDPLHDRDEGIADPLASGVAVMLLWLFALAMLIIVPWVTRPQPAGRGWYLAPANWPILTLAIALLAGGLLLWRWARPGHAVGRRAFLRRAMSAFEGMGATLAYALAFILYVQVIGWAGFTVATVLFVAFLFWASGLRGWVWTLRGLLLSLGLVAVFRGLIGIWFPVAPLWRWLPDPVLRAIGGWL